MIEYSYKASTWKAEAGRGHHGHHRNTFIFNTERIGELMYNLQLLS